jgi:hypothetical protein
MSTLTPAAKVRTAATILPSPLLRRALVADALTSGACGLVLAAAAQPLSGLLGLPTGLLRGAGLALLPFAALVAWLGIRTALPRAAVWALVAVNALWVVESVVLVLSGWVQPTGLGVAFVLAQAVLVALLAELEVVGLRRSA